MLLPFSPGCLEMSWEPRVRKATVVIMGSHTAGKSSVRKRLAERMQWESDEEARYFHARRERGARQIPNGLG